MKAHRLKESNCTSVSLNSWEARVNGKSIWTEHTEQWLKGIERRWRKEVKDLSFLIPGSYSCTYSAMSQNIKVFSIGDFPIGQRESHPQPEHRKLVFFNWSHRILRIHQWGQRILQKPWWTSRWNKLWESPPHFIPVETAKLAWQANNHPSWR